MTATNVKATLEAIREDIVAHPQDDTPRLVYADFLDEYSLDPLRAEFIRVQIEIVAISRQQDEFSKADISHFDHERAVVDKRQDFLRHREVQLLAAWCGAWISERRFSPDWYPCSIHGEDRHGEWINWNGTTAHHIFADFRRGWIGKITCEQAAWLAHGPAIVRLFPIEEVSLSDRMPGGREGAFSPRYWSCTEMADTVQQPESPASLDRRLFKNLSPVGIGKSEMSPMYYQQPGRMRFRWYEPDENPAADLSHACLLYARETK